MNGPRNRISPALSARSAAQSPSHFLLLPRWRVKLSDAESWTWALTELATIGALIFILVDFTRSPNFSAGAIYAVLAYVYDYLEGLNQVPTLINNLARLKDVRVRL